MNTLRYLGLSLVIIFLSVSTVQADTSKFPGTAEGALLLLNQFLAPGADVKKLSMEFAPTKADYESYFVPAFVGKAENIYGKPWEKGEIIIQPKPGQTEIILVGFSVADIKAWKGEVVKDLPGGYEKVKDKLKPGNTVYRFKFVKPGEKLGMAYDGLTYTNGHWVLFPKPWRALGK